MNIENVNFCVRRDLRRKGQAIKMGKKLLCFSVFDQNVMCRSRNESYLEFPTQNERMVCRSRSFELYTLKSRLNLDNLYNKINKRLINSH